MKSLLSPVLNAAMAKLNKQVPQTKGSTQSIDISEVRPKDLAAFMSDNNVPDDCYFDGTENAYDAWEVDSTKLTWDIQIPTTDADKLRYKRKRFQSILWHALYPVLLANGYKRISSGSDKFKQFDDTTLYDMVVDGNIDRVIAYYSLSFAKA